MRRKKQASWTGWLALAVVGALAGCSPKPANRIEPVEGFGQPDSGADPDAEVGRPDAGLQDSGDEDGGEDELDGGAVAPDAGGDGGQDAGAPPVYLDDEPLAFGVTANDRSVTSVALLDPEGELLQADFISSGAAPAGLTTALSGDVVLPTRSGDPKTLTLLDRFRTDVITRLDPMRGVVLGQVRTHEGSDTSYSSNPQDFVYLGPGDAWVTRYNPDLVGAGGEQGTDLVHLDPTEMMLSGRRIDLSALNGKGERENPDTGEVEEVTVFARPGKIVRLGEHLVAGLSRLSASFDAIGDGMVALVDLEQEQAEGFVLPGLQNCTQVVPVPDDPERVAVACTGFYRGEPRATAGIALLRLEQGALMVERLWQAKTDPDSALTIYGLVALSATRLVAVEPGARAQTNDDGEELSPATVDVLYEIDLQSGEQREVFRAGGRFVIGDGTFSPRGGLLLIPDGSVDDEGTPTAGVRRFHVQGDEFQELDLVEVHDALPVRQVAPL